MPNGISKRQQLRNEKTLAELIRTIPGNDRCADCDALTPGTLPRCDTMLLTMTIPLSSSIELILSLAINRMGKLERTICHHHSNPIRSPISDSAD